jgi:hypothetical protein
MIFVVPISIPALLLCLLYIRFPRFTRSALLLYLSAGFVGIEYIAFSEDSSAVGGPLMLWGFVWLIALILAAIFLPVPPKPDRRRFANGYRPYTYQKPVSVPPIRGFRSREFY